MQPEPAPVLCTSPFSSVSCFKALKPAGSLKSPAETLPPVLRIPVAHRGVPNLDIRTLPTNSAEAVSRSLELGIPVIELDVRLSTDGQLYLFHDKWLDPKWFSFPQHLSGRKSFSFSSADVKEIMHRFPPSVPKSTKPIGLSFFDSLAPVFNARPGLILLDLKGNFAEVFAVLVPAAGPLAPRILIQCYEKSQLESVRKNAPAFGVMARVSPEFNLEEALNLSPELVQIDGEAVTPETVERIHRSGAKIMVKTLSDDTPERWNYLFAAGVDSILTDRADEILGN